jgi:hypothetical protein
MLLFSAALKRSQHTLARHCIAATAALPYAQRRGVADHRKEWNEDYFKTLRIYKDLRTSELLLKFTFNYLFRFEAFVDNFDRLYRTTNKMLGATVSDFIMRRTAAKLFLAGENFEDLKEAAQRWGARGTNPHAT